VLKFLAKISVETETVLDGVQATDIVFSKPPGYYSIILVRRPPFSRTLLPPSLRLHTNRLTTV
jgi:hypothetical protein